MKKIIVATVFVLLSFSVKSQNASVEDHVFGVQTGFLGLYFHGETKLSDKFALRGELGLDFGFWERGIYQDNRGFLLTPVIVIEPRFYYNLEKRVKKSKRIDGNSGNFISIKTSFNPDLFTISSDQNVSIIPTLQIVPTWGIRRNLGKHFNYETGIGIGYYKEFYKQNGYSSNESGTAINLHLRIGYRF
ncbi:hypothetical protein JBL43_00700 [Aureibaculum sp. A20]|uniref:DUF3575 domain-containing protein n=1 Tax=Aureibaculum flavum TaxID=2795986 RepID=A0ABS0WLC3_9FLAO|nr:hypothetical protein [Aureibaculum flavum]MBJ2172734.1 hypothetical protein [Aureibaculum flavum]